MIEYGLLYMLMVKIPMVTKALTAQLRFPFLPLKTGFNVAAVLYMLLTGVLVYFWTQTVPVLIRPVFTWVSTSPPAKATVPLQHYEWVIIFVAIVIAAFRMLLQGMTAFRSEVGKPLEELERELRDLPPVSSLGDRINPWFSRCGRRVVVGSDDCGNIQIVDRSRSYRSVDFCAAGGPQTVNSRSFRSLGEVDG